MKKFILLLVALGSTVVFVIACSSDEESGSSSSCTLTSNTVATNTVNAYSCAVLTRDTSSCQASRTAQGLSGFWLNFSCRITLTVSGSNVLIAVDGQPDYKSNYFEESNVCYEEFMDRTQNPGSIGELSIELTVPDTPAGGTATMPGGIVGVAVNGVAIFDNEAAPGDNIYDEVQTFDRCQGHPAGTTYHYHIEPDAISSNDSTFVGIMRDGNPVYGRLEDGGGTPTLDTEGGHTSATPDSATPIYHYHVNLQTDGIDSAYFVTSGTYKNSPGTCTGCN